MKTATKGFLPNLQVTRLIAASMVLVSHVEHELWSTNGGPTQLPVVHTAWLGGVDLFFVVSGFVMFYLTREHFGRQGYWAEFLKRRIIRVVPLYWLFTAAMLAVIGLLGQYVHQSVVTPDRLVRSLLFLPQPAGGAPVMALGWTLNYEMFFYLCFAGALTLPRRLGLTLLVAGFAAAPLAGAILPATWGEARFLLSPMLLEFLLGIGLAALFVRGVRLPLAARLGLVALGVVGFAAMAAAGLVDSPLRVLACGAPGAVLAAGMLLGPHIPENARWARLAVLGGDASYALYLSHPFSLRATMLVLKRAHVHSELVLLIVGLVASYAVAIGVYLWIEKPVLAVLRNTFEPRRAVLPA